MKIGIKSIEYYLPKKVISNDELAERFADWSKEKIFEKTGIAYRHAAVDETVLDMAEQAAKKLFHNSELKPEMVDFIIFATQSPDYLLPTTACLLQNRLGIPTSAGAFDYNLGCSAFIYGLALAKSLIYSGIAKNILLIMSETYTKYLHPMDKSVCTIFGDGAAAAWIAQDKISNIGLFDLGTDGSGAMNLIVPSGGSKNPRTESSADEIIDEDGNIRTKNNLYMNGPEIFTFTIKTVPQSVKKALEINNLTQEDIDLFVFHQANAYMLNYLKKKCKICDDKFYINLENTGNTVSATIPIALKMAEDEGRLKKGDRVLLSGFGVGLSWGSTVIIY